MEIYSYKVLVKQPKIWPRRLDDEIILYTNIILVKINDIASSSKIEN